jgi:hypothetical protein
MEKRCNCKILDMIGGDNINSLKILNEAFRQFGKTTMLAELAMLQFYKELKRMEFRHCTQKRAKRKHRTLKDVINRNRR